MIKHIEIYYHFIWEKKSSIIYFH